MMGKVSGGEPPHKNMFRILGRMEGKPILIQMANGKIMQTQPSKIKRSQLEVLKKLKMGEWYDNSVLKG